MQNAIDYLDHAPAGFFSAGRKGEIFYVNATLAEWLGIDLTKFMPGSMTIGDLVAGEGLALIQSVQAEPGLKKTETLDLDLRKANGQSLPVQHRPPRLLHPRRRAGRKPHDRAAAPSDDESDQSASAAAMRFTRFFNNTPMAIASVDGERPDPAHQCPVPEAVLRHRVAATMWSTAQRSKPSFRKATASGCSEALAAAKDRQGDIAPIDSRHPTDEARAFPLLRQRRHRPERRGAGRGRDRLCRRDHASRRRWKPRWRRRRR